MIAENRLNWYSGEGYCYVDVDSSHRYGFCAWMPISHEGDKLRLIDDVRAAEIQKTKVPY